MPPSELAPIRLTGDARTRGLAQATARPELAGAVRDAVAMRLGEGAALRTARAARLLAACREVVAREAPEALAEIGGLAAGYGIDPDELFAYLHLGVLADLARTPQADPDGCSAWAVTGGADGPLVVKNRDFRGEHRGLQQVFLHRDPVWGGREMLCVGSLGSPGAYSSGMNSDGLALVDTQIGTTDHGPGLLRYFAMTRVLAGCADVPEALDLLGRLPHLGGGSLVLADAGGRVAAVELGHSAVAVEQGVAWVARTNHFVSPDLAPNFLGHPGEPMARSTLARLAALRAEVDAREWTAGAAFGLMARHGGDGALCRHGQDGDSSTISTAVFAPATRRLYIALGNPCAAPVMSCGFGA